MMRRLPLIFVLGLAAAPALAQHPIALSLEVRDIDPELSPKTGTIRDHLTDPDT